MADSSDELINSSQKTELIFGRYGRLHDDHYPSPSTLAQFEVERSVGLIFGIDLAEKDEKRRKLGSQPIREIHQQRLLQLKRCQHVEYLKKNLFTTLSESMVSLDCSRPWMVYWITHSLALLGEQQFLTEGEHAHALVGFLKRCQSKDEGGYCGGPGQFAHLAATYAAVNAIITIGSHIAYQSIDRKALRRFFLSMQQPDGSFTLHRNGEVDIRGVYCAMSVAKLLQIDTMPSDPEEEVLFAKTADWILSCQTYEGGFGAAPGHEAHGGYTFCGVACLVMLNQLHRCDVNALLRWTAYKQLPLEGGFCGRTNKLVDGCYSFWNGAVIPIIQTWITKNENDTPQYRWLFNQEMLQQYVLACCQSWTGGGLVDKPGKNRDFYHTCYTLSGLSIAQHSFNSCLVLGPEENLLEPLHPIFNLTLGAVKELQEFLRESYMQ